MKKNWNSQGKSPKKPENKSRPTGVPSPKEGTYYVYGRNAARECLKSHSAEHVYTRERFSHDELVLLANENGIPVSFIDDAVLDSLASSGKHQGFVVEARLPETVSLKDLIAIGKGKQYPLILVLDGIEDPNNLGAILRSCDAFGVDGVVVKTRGNVLVNPTVAKVSTGAVHYVPLCAVPNLSQALSELKDAGYWVVSSDGSADKRHDEIDYKMPVALVVGSEGFGISRLVLERSDFIVKIPMVGHVNSLNASVATGVLLSHILISRI